MLTKLSHYLSIASIWLYLTIKCAVDRTYKYDNIFELMSFRPDGLKVVPEEDELFRLLNLAYYTNFNTLGPNKRTRLFVGCKSNIIIIFDDMSYHISYITFKDTRFIDAIRAGRLKNYSLSTQQEFIYHARTRPIIPPAAYNEVKFCVGAKTTKYLLDLCKEH